jgi:hypothetical protein
MSNAAADGLVGGPERLKKPHEGMKVKRRGRKA